MPNLDGIELGILPNLGRLVRLVDRPGTCRDPTSCGAINYLEMTIDALSRATGTELGLSPLWVGS